MQSLTTAALGRRVPTDAELDALVSAELQRQCGARAVLTATDITRALRVANPGIEIDHGRVRDRVHGAMAQALVAGLYVRTTEFVTQAGTTALVYRPAAPPQVQAAVQPVPQVQARAAKAAPPSAIQGQTFGPAGLLLPPADE